MNDIVEPTNPQALRMWGWLPVMWYARSRTAAGILEAQGELLDQLFVDAQAVSDARLPQTAPEWGLERLEQEVGLTPAPELPIEERRARIMARFRAFGSTIARLRTIALSWNYGDIAIVPDPEAFRLNIEFIDELGVPADIQSHQAEMRANVQAHLDIGWEYRFLLWDEVRVAGILWHQPKDANITWEEIKTMSVDDLLARMGG